MDSIRQLLLLELCPIDSDGFLEVTWLVEKIYFIDTLSFSKVTLLLSGYLVGVLSKVGKIGEHFLLQAVFKIKKNLKMNCHSPIAYLRIL